jgi:hypothetical protein
MNEYDEEERRNYAYEKNASGKSAWRYSDRQSVVSLGGPGSGGNSPLSPDSEYAESDLGSTSSVSIRSISTANLGMGNNPELPASPTSRFPTSPTSSTFSTSSKEGEKEKHGLSSIWKKMARSNRKHAGRAPAGYNQNSLLRAQIAAATAIDTNQNQRPFHHNQNHNHSYPDLVGDRVIGQDLCVGRAL